MKKLLILSAVLFTGCAGMDAAFIDELSIDEMEQKIDNSPEIKFLTDKRFEQITLPEDIQVYYIKFHPFSEPNLVDNWQQMYVLGEPSSPEWKYRKIAQLKIYLPNGHIKEGINLLKEEASKIGGDAVIDVFREPITKLWSRSYVGPYKVEKEIIGYKYLAYVVKNKTK